jgi:molecular chaperone DnaJ
VFVIFVAGVHLEKEVGASQEDTDKSKAAGDWLKKLTHFAG